MNTEQKLKEKGLRATLQRVAVLEAVTILNNHPTAEQIIEFVKKNNSVISIGTIYKVLDSLVENGLIKKVRTEQGLMRYDAVLGKHHHLHCNDSNEIFDFNDPELDNLLEKYFKNKRIPDFEIKDISIQIDGKFINHKFQSKSNKHK